MKYTVVITSELPPVAMQMLAGEFDVISHSSEGVRTEEEMVTILAEADGAITLLSDPLTRRVLESNSNLRVVANYAVGYNNVDLDAARELGIAVTNTPGVLTEATADLTMALILAVTRRVAEGDAYVRRTGLVEWAPLAWLGSSLQGRQLGVIGMGRIGFATATRARAFGMSVVYSGPSARPESDRQHESRRVALDELFTTSDIVSVHCPLNEETRHLVDDAALGRTKASAFLINTSRGPIVDERALCDALENRRIAGAGLDVFENEPHVGERLRSFSNVVLLPHIGSATFETRSEMARIAASNVQAVLRGRPPFTPVG